MVGSFCLFAFFVFSMQSIVDLVNSAINNYHIDNPNIQNVQASMDKEMKVDGWISLILSNRGMCSIEIR